MFDVACRVTATGTYGDSFLWNAVDDLARESGLFSFHGSGEFPEISKTLSVKRLTEETTQIQDTLGDA